MTDFDLVTSRHKWMPGALEMARQVAYSLKTPDSVRAIYKLLAAELRLSGARK